MLFKDIAKTDFQKFESENSSNNCEGMSGWSTTIFGFAPEVHPAKETMSKTGKDVCAESNATAQ